MLENKTMENNIGKTKCGEKNCQTEKFHVPNIILQSARRFYIIPHWWRWNGKKNVGIKRSRMKSSKWRKMKEINGRKKQRIERPNRILKQNINPKIDLTFAHFFPFILVVHTIRPLSFFLFICFISGEHVHHKRRCNLSKCL